MYQVLLRENYKFDESKFLLFLSTLQSYKKRKPEGESSFLTKVMNFIESEARFQYVIDCDKDGKVSFYYNDLSNNADRFLTALKQFVGSDGDVVEAFNLEDYLETHTLSYEEAILEKYEDGSPKIKTSLKAFDDDIVKFILTSMPKFTRICIEFSCKPLHWKDMKKRGYNVEETNHSELTCTFQVHCKTKYMRNELTTLSNTIRQVTRGTGAFYLEYKNKYKPFKVSTAYMLNLMAMPKAEDVKNQIYCLSRLQRTLEPGEYSSGIKIGTNSHPKQRDREIRVPLSQLEKHVLITGSTGSGKSSVFEEIARDIFEQKCEGKTKVGFTFFDPAEVSALGLINIIRQMETEGFDTSKLWKVVHYIDFNSEKNIFTMNLLDKAVNKEKHMDYFRDIFGEGNTPQLDRLLINAITALIEDEAEHVISDVLKVLQDEEYRGDLSDRLRKSKYSQASVEFLERGIPSKKTAIDPVLNRLDIFTNSVRKNRMFNSGISDLNDIRKWMDEGHILIFNLSGMAEKDIKIIVGYILLQYYNEAIKRPVNSLSHFVAVDEDHKVQLKIINNIRAECRKFGLHFIGMTQFLDQYREDYLRDSIENTGTKITLRQGEIGASRMARSTDINKEEYTKLADRNGFLYTQNGSTISSIPFVAKPPYRYKNGKLIEFGKAKFKELIEEATENDRGIALNLMARDFKKITEIDKLVYKDKSKRVAIKDEVF